MLKVQVLVLVEQVVIELLILVQLVVEHQFQYNPIQLLLEAAVQDQLLTLLKVSMDQLQHLVQLIQQVVVAAVLVSKLLNQEQTVVQVVAVLL